MIMVSSMPRGSLSWAQRHLSLYSGMRCGILTVLLLFGCLSNALGLAYIETNGIYLYYPTGEEKIVSRLRNSIPSMTAFLDGKGLPLTYPLHIVLDDELDRPEVVVHMIPHREIRIPLRAPGVLEEGYLEADPWTYFLFRGLCLQGLYGMRSGIPDMAHTAFGEVISPNVVIPQWLEDGICALLYTLYTGNGAQDTFAKAVFDASVPPDMAKLSNHPGIWPGHFAYKIFGRPFIAWVYQRYGWDGLLRFMSAHGAGIIPIEIDLKARKTLGKTWITLWDDFRAELPSTVQGSDGMLIDGYWPEPFCSWNVSGIFPGVERTRLRGRYGYRDEGGTLWVSEYDDENIAHVIGYRRGVSLPLERKHVWDPGPGDVAVTRKGHQPFLILIEKEEIPCGWMRIRKTSPLIPGPPGAIQLSGPMRNRAGHIAVAANMDGNWDIWLYDGAWHRATSAPSIEMDPWWEDDTLVFSSDVSGAFEIYSSGMVRLTDSPHGATLPRGGKYLRLARNGWQIEEYAAKHPAEAERPLLTATPMNGGDEVELDARPYTPWPSIWPNYLVPDLYIGASDIQVGLATWSRDVTEDYTTNAGFRYAFDEHYFSVRLGGTVKKLGVQASRYPLSYTSNQGKTDESRIEAKLAWMPFDPDLMEISLYRLAYEEIESSERDRDLWGSIGFMKQYGEIATWGAFEAYSGGRRSLFGGVWLRMGSEIYSTFHIQAGKTWNGYVPGHGSFRIGGDVGEGYFTQRPSRLFPLRGFSSNVLEAGEALTSGLEIFWPLINLQKGYATLPLYFHRLRLGTFLDAGACRDQMSRDDILLGAGLELITSLEIAWGNLSSFRIGVSWPVHQPDYLDAHGPVFLLQIGGPL